MFKRFFMAFVSSAKTQLTKVRITVGKSGEQTGYYKSSYGSCEVLDGATSVIRLYSNGNTTYCVISDVYSGVELSNVTTGKSIYVYSTGTTVAGGFKYSAAGNIFEGISDGQKCEIEIYKVV